MDEISYLKCEISEFRASTASINVISAGNIPEGNTRIIHSLKLNYGFSNTTNNPYYEPGALFQIGFKVTKLVLKVKHYFCRMYQNNPIDKFITGTSVITTIDSGIWKLALSDQPNNNPTFESDGTKIYTTNYIVDLNFNPNGGTALNGESYNWRTFNVC